MPYITKEDRNRIAGFAEEEIYIGQIRNGGDLNYSISILCAQYIREHGISYKNISDVIGALEGAKQEFFRKVVDSYENLKEMQNGGVYSDIEDEIERQYCESEPPIGI